MEDGQEIGAYMFRRTVPSLHLTHDDVRWMVCCQIFYSINGYHISCLELFYRLLNVFGYKFCSLLQPQVGAWRDRIIICTGIYGPTRALIKAFLDSGAKAVICPSAEPQDMQLPTFHGSGEFSSLVNGRFEIGEEEVEDEEAEPPSPTSDWEDSEPERSLERSMFYLDDDEEELSQFVCQLYESLFRGGARVDFALQHALASHRSLRYSCHLPSIP